MDMETTMTNIKNQPMQFAQALLDEVTALVESEAVSRTRGEATHWTHTMKHWLDQKGK